MLNKLAFSRKKSVYISEFHPSSLAPSNTFCRYFMYEITELENSNVHMAT